MSDINTEAQNVPSHSGSYDEVLVSLQKSMGSISEMIDQLEAETLSLAERSTQVSSMLTQYRLEYSRMVRMTGTFHGEDEAKTIEGPAVWDPSTAIMPSKAQSFPPIS